MTTTSLNTQPLTISQQFDDYFTKEKERLEVKLLLLGFEKIGIKAVEKCKSFDIRGYSLEKIKGILFQNLNDFWENKKLGVQVQILPAKILVYVPGSYYPTSYSYSQIDTLVGNLELM